MSAVTDETMRAYTYAICGMASDEAVRSARHHDVLCLVLKELVRSEVHDEPEPVQVDIARRYADLAYPPPKPTSMTVSQQYDLADEYFPPPKAESK